MADNPKTTAAWQPIETALMEDGTSILLWDGRDAFEGYWEDSRNFWAMADGGMAFPSPTHWMPVPDGPVKAPSTMPTETTALHSEPEANWNDIWSMMQELGAAIAPLMELSSPPAWAISLRFVMDAALPDVEERCAKG